MGDPELRDRAEADFQQYYQLDIRDLYRKESGLTYRRAANLLWNLPAKSRTHQHLPEEHVLWTQEDHFFQDIIDLLTQILYYGITDATVKDGLRRSDIQKIHRAAPKRSRRPGERIEKPKFMSGRELKNTMFRNGTLPNPKGHKEKGG